MFSQTSPLLTYIHTKPQLGSIYLFLNQYCLTFDPAAKLNYIQRFQSYYFLPSLCLLHIYWSLESLAYILARIRTMYLSLCFWSASGHSPAFYLNFSDFVFSAYFNYWLFRDHGLLNFQSKRGKGQSHQNLR